MRYPPVLSTLLTLFCLPALALGPVGGQLDGALQSLVEQSAENAAQRAIENHVERMAEQAVEKAVEEQVAESVSSNVGQVVEQSVQQAVENGVAGSVENAVGQAVEKGVSTAVENAADQAVVRGLENAVSATVEQGVNGVAGGIPQGPPSGVLPEPALAALGEALSIGALSTGALSGEANPVRDSAGRILFLEVEVENQWLAVANEWLLLLSGDDLSMLEAIDAHILEHIRYDQLGMSLVRFQVADAINSRGDLAWLLPEGEYQELERHHVYSYRPQGGERSGVGSPVREAPVCEDALTVGIVDTAVNGAVKTFAGNAIQQRNFLPAGIETPLDHGTAVAGVLVGNGEGLQPLLPNASLVVASVMYQREDGSQGATLLTLLDAMDWLAGQGVDVVNMSLAGPPNGILERAVEALAGRNITLVAAVGNDGPSAPPRYPAAYPAVIGATAVDRDKRVYRWANRGDQVAFAAMGVGVNTAAADGGVAVESGTSMAAPVVSAFAACFARGQDASRAVPLLAEMSIDLGEPGRDPVFGHGLLK